MAAGVEGREGGGAGSGAVAGGRVDIWACTGDSIRLTMVATHIRPESRFRNSDIRLDMSVLNTYPDISKLESYYERKSPGFTKLRKILQCKPQEGVYLLSQVRNYGHHPLEKRTPEIKPDIHDVSQNELRLLVYLHDVGQFYFEHLFLAYCGFADTRARTEFGCYRPLLRELNSV